MPREEGASRHVGSSGQNSLTPARPHPASGVVELDLELPLVGCVEGEVAQAVVLNDALREVLLVVPGR